jgi:beta-lactamase regulating signal transducer with metallopeptidase domain
MFTSLESFNAVWLPVLLDATIKGAALLVLAGVVARCMMRRTSAAPRHAVWMLAMVGLLLLPLLSTALPGWRILPQWCDFRVTTTAASATLTPDSLSEVTHLSGAPSPTHYICSIECCIDHLPCRASQRLQADSLSGCC